MLKITQISSRGQITIPVWIRQKLILEETKQVMLWPSIETGEIIIKPLAKQSLSQLRGSVRPQKKPENWHLIRKEVKKKIAEKNIINRDK